MSIIQLQADIETMEEYEPLPDGVYPAELQDVELKANEKTPQGFLTCQYKIYPDHFPHDYDAANAPEGVIVTQGYVALPDPNNRRTVRPFNKFLEALGVERKGSSFDPQDLIGKQVQVTIKRAEYQGSWTNNIENVSALPSV